MLLAPINNRAVKIEAQVVFPVDSIRIEGQDRIVQVVPPVPRPDIADRKPRASREIARDRRQGRINEETEDLSNRVRAHALILVQEMQAKEILIPGMPEIEIRGQMRGKTSTPLPERAVMTETRISGVQPPAHRSLVLPWMIS